MIDINDDTREAYLLRAVDILRPAFWEAGGLIPAKVRVSVGFPKGGRRIVGQCWAPSAVSDGVVSMFISPVHKTAIEALETLVHELVHAAGKKGHRGEYSKLASKVGLVPPWKSAPAGKELAARLHAMTLSGDLGTWDNGWINWRERGRVQTTRMHKAMCPVDGYTVRLTRKWIDAMGHPTCPCGELMEGA